MPDRLLGCLPLAFRIAIVGIGIWYARRKLRRPQEPPAWQEPEDGVQPVDVYLVTLSRDDPRIGTFSRN